MDSPRFFLFLLIVLIGTPFAYMSISLLRDKLKRKRAEKVEKTFLEMARRLGVRFCHNTIGNVIAVCKVEDRDIALEKFEMDAFNGKLPKWEKIILWVTPTFTFSTLSYVDAFVHAGTEADMDKIVEDFLFYQTGIAKSAVPPYVFKKAVEIVSQEDKRIFVPYASDSQADMKKQYEFFKAGDLGAAMIYFLGHS
jgi:hypothetical protein